MIKGRIHSLLVGKSVSFAREGVVSAIDKKPVDRSLSVHWLGLTGDEQGDPRFHGGMDKAIHAYTWGHYEAWRRELPNCRMWDMPGAFGENFSIEGLDESSVCIGDEFGVGSAILQVTQGRQPCWKLNHRFGVPDMSARVQDSLRAGWYFRVLKRGAVSPGDTIELLARPCSQWSVARLLALIRDKNCDPSVLQEVLALPLPASWRKLFERRVESRKVEDWSPRMQGAERA